MSSDHFLKIIPIILYGMQSVTSVSLLKNPPYFIDEPLHSDIFQNLNNKEYLPQENELPESSILKDDGDDATYILSKLSEVELIKLLNEHPKRDEYELDDLLKISGDLKDIKGFNTERGSVSGPQNAFFKLEDKPVDPYNYNINADPKYNALQKLNNVLYSRPQRDGSEENDETKQMLFDVLVAQLKSLCCKKHKPKINKNNIKLKSLLHNDRTQKINKKPLAEKSKEHIFLIINDEIKSNVTDELIAVDPDSLSKNSSVLLLGPITTPLSEVQLKLVMNRIQNEISKPEYLPLLQKVSEGTFEANNIGLSNSLLAGTDLRRYIKPHRCNHQSKLAKIYGGPKWLICTGYLNINTPSLYD